jgi:hypothetical protein
MYVEMGREREGGKKKFIRRQVRTSLKGCGKGMDKDEIFEAA